MKEKKRSLIPIIVFILINLSFASCFREFEQTTNHLQVYHETESNELAIVYGNDLLSIFRYDSSLYKPFFFPVNDINGNRLTRGYPLDPLPGEPTDHLHQTGMWFNFGDVNGIDFWNNSDAVSVDKLFRYGRIVCRSMVLDTEKIEENSFHFTTYSDWIHDKGKKLLLEKTDFYISVNDTFWSIERKTRLKAATEVRITDNKEGLFAIRLSREFQSDMDKPAFVLDSSLNPSSQKIILNKGKYGHFFDAQGRTGNEVFGTQNKWVAVNALINEDSVSIVLLDHPDNFGFPASAFARDYGLFAINNFGKYSYNSDLDPVEISLPEGDSICLRHKILFHSGAFINPEQINNNFNKFVEEKE